MNAMNHDCWTIAEAVARVTGRCLFYGPPGTGKSYAAQRAGLDGKPMYNLTLTPDSPAAELRGHYIPRGGEFVWQDGPVVRAMREGARVVVNEIDHAGGDALSFLLAATDTVETCAITLPTGETVRPAPGYQVFATMNGNPDQDLGDALRSRFSCGIHIDAPHPAAIETLPEDLRDAARGTVCAESDDRRITLRAWLGFAALRGTVGTEIAALAHFGKDRAPDILQALRIARDDA